jgi:hypothetical protein
MKPAGTNPPPIIRPEFGLFLVILFAVWFVFVIPSLLTRGPSFAKQRTEQRKIVFERVRAGGGWDTLRQECEFLVTNAPRDAKFFWISSWTNAQFATGYSNHVQTFGYHTNIDAGPLPSVIASLQPSEVEFDWPANGATVVKIKLFGIHRTGLWDTPRYGLWVVCASTNRDYMPAPDPPYYKGVNKVADSTF